MSRLDPVPTRYAPVMEYRFRVVRKDGYLHVWVSGTNEADTVARYLKDIYEACVRHDCSSVLIEENLEGPRLDLGEIFGIVEDGSRSVWPVIQRVAFVDVHPSQKLANMKFAETVAVNRSVNMQAFGTPEEAERWMERELRPPPPSGRS